MGRRHAAAAGSVASGAAAAPPDSGWKDGAKADGILGHGEAGGDDASLSSLPATPQKRIIFVFASFLYALSFTISGPTLSFHAKALVLVDSNGMYYAAAMGAFAATKIPATVASGTAAQRTGHRITLSVSLLGLGVSLLLTGLTKSFTPLLICRLLTGVFGTNGALFQSLIPSISDYPIVLFTDWSMAWSAAFILSKYIIFWLQEDVTKCHVCGALCAIVSAAVVWFAYPIMVDNATAHKRRSMALRRAPRTAKGGDTPSHPEGGSNGVSAGADANGSASKSPSSTALATETPLLHSMLAFMSDTIIMAHTLCVVLTPRLDYALIAKEKGGSPGTVAGIHATGHVAVLAMQMLSLPTHLCRFFGSKPVVVLGTAAMAVPVLMMPLCSLSTFEWLSLAYLMLASLVEPGSRTIIQNRAPPQEVSVWIGWLHSARGLSQLTSTFGGAWLMAKDSNWLCMSIAVMQIALSGVFTVISIKDENTKRREKKE